MTDLLKTEPTPHNVDDLASHSSPFEVRVNQDGVNTIVEVVNVDADWTEDGEVVVGTGYARRRKGDRRNPAVGTALAAARAFQEAADGYAAVAKELLGE